MSDLGAGGYHWQEKERVEHWVDADRARAPERLEGFAALLARLPADTDAPMHVVDLGAGDGRVAQLVLERYPAATARLVDFSEEMITRGEQTLSDLAARLRYVRWDMNEGDWPTELIAPIDAVVSAAALHHLHNDRKRWLAQVVFDVLTPGGVFVNYDLFRDPAAVYADHEVHDRTCATVDEALGFLDQAGFVDVAVDAHTSRPGRKGRLAVVSGRKPADA